MSVSAVIFDLDGVIVDSAKYHFLSWGRLAESLGIPFTHEQNESLKGVSRADSLDRILEWGGVDKSPEEKQELMDRKNSWYLEFISKMERDEILEGVEPFIVALREAGYKVALGSSSKNARPILRQVGMIGLFDVIVDGTNINRSKPDPQVFLMGAEQLGLEPAVCLVFEDAYAGIQAALTGGFQAIGVGSAEELSNAPRVIPGFANFTVADL
ncbi:MAG: beta-phosphoglucomutase [Flavobacteriales bacterium]